MNNAQISPLWRFVAKRSPSIVPLNEGCPSCPVYFIHSVSGELTSLLELVRQLGAVGQINGVQVPQGLLGGEFPQSIQSVAAHYVKLVNAFQPAGPMILGGWSAGAIIALEMAQIFRQQGREIDLVVTFDGLLYNTPADRTRQAPKLYLTFIVKLLGRMLVELKARSPLRRIAQTAVHECVYPLRWLLGQRATANGLDVLLDPSAWPADQAAFALGLYDAAMGYAPRPYAGKILLFTAKTRPIFAMIRLIAAWRAIATDIDVIEIDGTHTTILHLPQVTGVAGELRKRLSVSAPVSA